MQVISKSAAVAKPAGSPISTQPRMVINACFIGMHCQLTNEF